MRDTAARGARGRGCALGRGGEGARGLTEQRQSAAAPRQHPHGLRSARYPSHPPSLRCGPSGAPGAAGGSPKDARHRPQIPSDWCRAEGEEPLPRGRGSARAPGLSGGPKWRSTAPSPRACRGPQPALLAPGATRLRRGRLGVVLLGKLLGLGGSGRVAVAGSPRTSALRFRSVRRAVTHRPPSSRGRL